MPTLVERISKEYRKIFVFDIETDGLLPWQRAGENDKDVAEVTRFVGGVVKQLGGPVLYSGPDINVLVTWLNQADLVVGHNIVSYDLPCLEYLGRRVDRPCLDTMLVAQLNNLDLKNAELEAIQRGRLKLPSEYIGRHSLAAWGFRLGLLKGDSGVSDWANAKWDTQMAAYCNRDVEVAECLLMAQADIDQRVLDVEHEFARNMALQQKWGIRFDLEAARALETKLRAELEVAVADLKGIYPPWQKFKRHGFEMYVDANGKRRRSATKKDIFETVEFNPGSLDHIAYVLIHFEGWKPTVKTPTGKPKVDESVLEDLPYKSIPALLRYMMLKKRLSQLVDGEAGLVPAGVSGRIHGSVKTLGTVSTRCAHASPNLAQVPKCGVEFGAEFRDLFKADDGWVLVGCDASGLELRCLAHYLARWDGGAYGKTVCEGKQSEGTDVHTVNQRAAGLPTRDAAKTFIYALISMG